MNADRVSRWEAPCAILLVLGTALAELGMRESYHRVAENPFHLTIVAALMAVLAIGDWLATACLGRGASRVARLCLVAAWALYCSQVFDTTLGAAGDERLLGLIEQNSWAVAAVSGTLAALLLSAQRWTMLQRAATVAAIVFVATQPLIVAARAAAVVWPPMSAEAKGRGLATREGSLDLTVLVLLDELNSNRAAPLAKVFEDEHYNVSTGTLIPVGDGTGKVVPEMFARQVFSAPKPCSLSAICSGNRVLDFHRIVASRADIDVVGFFHPYCDIQGLRWCRRAVVPEDMLSVDRWECASWRRTGWPEGLSAEQCDAVFRRGWNLMVESALKSIGDAPAWRSGGLLFLHLPLPHPPGRLGRASLQANYEDSLSRAAVLVRDLARRALEVPSRQVTFVVFSDHPLRQREWCSSQWVFSSLSCKPVPDLEDKLVPLIVASTGAVPAVQTITRNGEIFDLAASPPRP